MKTAFITGAATGIGKALTLKLDQEGWTVFATYNRRTPDDLIAASSDRLIALQCDVSDQASIDAAVNRFNAAHSHLDLLINNAGVAIANGPIEIADIGELRQMMDVNVWAALAFVRGFAPSLRAAPAGKIVNVGSSSVYLLLPGFSGYPITKTALATLTRHLRVEFLPFGVQACVLHPGSVDTDLNGLSEDVDATAEAYWDSIHPEASRNLYKKAFPAPGTQFGAVRKMPTADFADLVYLKIIKTKKLKAVYALGPYSEMSRRMFGLMPYSWFERLQKSLAKVAPDSSL